MAEAFFAVNRLGLPALAGTVRRESVAIGLSCWRASTPSPRLPIYCPCNHTKHTVLSHDLRHQATMSNRVSKGNRRSATDRTGPVVRRAFSMQQADAQLIEALRVRCATQGLLMNQSEVVRLGLHLLAEIGDEDLKTRAARLERLTSVRTSGTS